MSQTGNKSVILLLYGVALYFILKRYYQTNSGLPNPKVLAPPTYIYGIAAVTSGFLGGFPIIVAAGMTVALIWQTKKNPTVPNMTTSPTAGLEPQLEGPLGTPTGGKGSSTRTAAQAAANPPGFSG